MQWKSRLLAPVLTDPEVLKSFQTCLDEETNKNRGKVKSKK